MFDQFPIPWERQFSRVIPLNIMYCAKRNLKPSVSSRTRKIPRTLNSKIRILPRHGDQNYQRKLRRSCISCTVMLYASLCLFPESDFRSNSTEFGWKSNDVNGEIRRSNFVALYLPRRAPRCASFGRSHQLE